MGLYANCVRAKLPADLGSLLETASVGCLECADDIT